MDLTIQFFIEMWKDLPHLHISIRSLQWSLTLVLVFLDEIVFGSAERIKGITLLDVSLRRPFVRLGCWLALNTLWLIALAVA